MVAKLIEIFGKLDGAQFLAAGKPGAFVKKEQALYQDRDLAALSRE
jgi:hypothetical protein